MPSRGIKSGVLSAGLVGVLVFILSTSSPAFADDGALDPDFDYLPPENIGLLGSVTNFALSWFRAPSHAGSFGTAKRRLYGKLDDTETFYCGCKVDLAQRTFDRRDCNYVPVNDNVRAKRVEAEHILPAFWIAKFHAGPSCWVKDEATCGGARECCLENDARFRACGHSYYALRARRILPLAL